MNAPWSRSHAFAVGLTLALVGCSGGDASPVGPGGNGNDNGGGGPPTPKADPSFSADIVPIFSSGGCTAGGCHGPPVQAGLNLASAPYTALVNVPSSEVSGEIRVIPGNADGSWLVKKLEGRQTFGDRMPLGGQLDEVDLANIKNWINQGAKNN